MNKEIIATIKIIHSRLNSNIRWAIVGSTNMQIQGMNINPRDLDIVIRHQDLIKVSKIFSDYGASNVQKLETLSNELVWEVKALIKGIEVQFFGGDDNDIYVSKLLANKISYISFKGIKVPCFTLIDESLAYIETNRKNKADLIQEYLNKKGNS